jgi:spore germination protein GerM
MGEAEKNRARLILISGLIVVLAVLIIIFFKGGERESIKHSLDTNLPKSQAPAVESAATKSVTLFFVSDDDGKLHGETREITTGATPANEAERALTELIKGSAKDLVSPLPPETRVRQVFVTKEGVAYVDFSRDVTEKFSYGSSAELSAVYAVVNTLAFNFKSIKKVVILIEGTERETLAGHVDLTRPFLPDYSLVAK